MTARHKESYRESPSAESSTEPAVRLATPEEVARARHVVRIEKHPLPHPCVGGSALPVQGTALKICTLCSRAWMDPEDGGKKGRIRSRVELGMGIPRVKAVVKRRGVYLTFRIDAFGEPARAPICYARSEPHVFASFLTEYEAHWLATELASKLERLVASRHLKSIRPKRVPVVADEDEEGDEDDKAIPPNAIPPALSHSRGVT